MSQPLPIAFAGAGIVAGPYAKAVLRTPGVRFAGVFDPLAERAQAVTGQLGGQVFASLDALLASPDVAAVVVMTPNHLHVEIASLCIKQGKHVLIEKPVAQSVEEIERLAALAARHGVVCMPAHNYVYAPALIRARRLVMEGAFGQLASLWILYNIFHAEEVAARYGGVLREVCVHHAYSLLFLLGRPASVTATLSRVHYAQLAAEDQAMLTCGMPDGAQAHLWASFAASDPTSDPWTVVYKLLGTKGGLAYTWNEAQFQDDGGPAWGIPAYLDSFAAELAFFAEDAIGRGAAPLSTLVDAADAIRVIEAAERSVAEGRAGVPISWRATDPRPERPERR